MMSKYIDLFRFWKDNFITRENVLDQNDIDYLLNQIKIELKDPNKVLGHVHSQRHRVDLNLKFTPKILKIIHKICDSFSPIVNAYFTNPIISECSALIAFPGCNSQVWHTDTMRVATDTSDISNLITFGVSLSEWDNGMGGTEYYPGSQVIYDYLNYILPSAVLPDKEKNTTVDEDNMDACRTNQPLEVDCRKLGISRQRVVCPAGTGLVWSSKVAHRGGKNRSNKVRPMFYFSLLSKGKPVPFGSVYSLHPNNPVLTLTDANCR